MANETKSSPEEGNRFFETDSGWTVPAQKVGVPRRTVLKGAAWSVPVIAVAVTAPLAAASVATPTLAFTQPSYTGAGCAMIASVQIIRTTDGSTPDAGKTITATLTDGYTFADGSTTYTAIADASGTITLPDINVPAGGGTHMFSAISDALNATAPVTSTVGPATVKTFAGNATSPALPAGVTVTSLQTTYDTAGDRWVVVLGSDGNTYRTQLPSGSTTFSAWATSPSFPNATTLTAMSNSGTMITMVSDGTTVKNFASNATAPGLPAGVTITSLQTTVDSTNITWVVVQGSDGNTYRTQLPSGSTTFSAWATSPSFPNATTLTAMSNSGTMITMVSDGTTVKNFAGTATAPALPAGVTITSLQTTVDSSSNSWVLVQGSDGNAYRTQLPSGSTTFSAWATSASFPNTTTLTALSNNSTGFAMVSDGTTVKNFAGNVTAPALPAGVTVTSLQYTVDSSNNQWVVVQGSDGNAYRTQLPSGSTTFTAWSTSPAFTDTTTFTALSNNSTGLIVVAGTAC